jgi:uncharacterized LabA/DUF88 family protein
MSKRVVMIIDGSNLYLSAKRCGIRIWPPDLLKVIVPKLFGELDPVVKVHFFTSADRANAAQQRFLNHISKTGIIVHDYDLRIYENKNPCPECDRTCQACGRDLRLKPHKEKMIDIAMATEMIELAYLKEPYPYDSFVIVSGDKDLIPAIRFIRRKLGKEVVIAGFRHKDPDKNSLAYELNREADQIINLLEILDG